MSTRHTYHHTFRDGTTATLILDERAPSFECQWSGTQTKALIPEYLVWRDSCMADFTRRTGLRVLTITC